ncbi:MAG: ABC transporter permease subunit [Rubinisphaera brasiliensis]|uniref:Abortive infection protein n=1 Tax=Rubinisphaera brasiliensis (strain ATCC 49424 / DSM 5305 / JCM 21570 / IAM 15109 / NBRC 103401 / IFAM 1448) TaxID=756272 RepID=F0ST25_RUBBR|nr:ABC transporter permease subunit [Rubinisphaera brasiliensis]ADY58180.1 Abortive infection protein [Rubinisphaera brasiliensis DSM 5305]
MSVVSRFGGLLAGLMGRQERILILKELRETLRDRRTIVTLFAMPLLLYPLLGLAFRFLALQQASTGPPEYCIAIENDEDATWLLHAMRLGEERMEQQFRATGFLDRPTECPPQVSFYVLDRQEPGRLEQIVAGGQADLGVRIHYRDQMMTRDLPGAHVETVKCDGSLVSHEAADYIEERLSAITDAMIAPQLRPVSLQIPRGLSEQSHIVEPQRQSTALLSLLPLVLLLMTVTGGVYPAIDLTAGERERDTLESLMALPLPRYRILFAKFLAVVAVTLLTGLMNLLAMCVTMYSLQLESMLFGADGLTALLVFKLFTVLVVFGFFYATLLLLLTCSARSFKEAQAYLIPLLMLSLAPGVSIAMPGWELNYQTALLPLMNMLLLARELFENTASLGPSLLALLATAAYGVVALYAASRIFGNDAVSHGSSSNWAELFRRPEKRVAAPSLVMSFGLLLALIPAYIFASGFLARFVDLSMDWRLLMSGVTTILLFGVFPLAVLKWYRVDWNTALRLRTTRVFSWPAALLMGLFAWPWIFELVRLTNSWGWTSFGDRQFNQVSALLDSWSATPFPVLLLVMAVLPGICEELFFRGVLLSGLRRRFSWRMSILLSALAFGAFHVVLAGGLSPERIVPSTVMGLLLGWVAWEAGSVLPAVLLHVVHNSTLLTLARYRDEIALYTQGLGVDYHLPPLWLAISAVCLFLGAIMMHRRNSLAWHPVPKHVSA